MKILAVAAALVLLSQAGTVVAVLVTANRDVAERARQQLDAGGRIFAQTAQARASQLGSTVSVLAADYAFKQAVASRDIGTISSALANHARRAGAQVAYLLDDAGTVIAASGTAAGAGSQQPALVSEAAERGMARSLDLHDGQAYEMLTVPVRAPLPVAWVSMGFALNDAYMQRIEVLTGLHASLVARPAGTPALVASSLQGPIRDEIAATLRRARPGSATTLAIADGEYLVMAQPFLPDSPDMMVVLTESLSDAMAPYELLQAAAFFLGAFPLLLALGGAVLLSRALTKPVSQLAEAARRMRVGDYSRPVTVESGDELAELAGTFNAMQDDIARREERITHQARHDSLTGLPNRDYALQLLGEAIAPGGAGSGKAAVVALDLNACAEIAASLGHDIADDYVRQAASQLRRLLPPQVALARLEGDHFLAILPGMDANEAADLAGLLAEKLDAGISLPDLTVSVRPVTGVAVFPDHGETADQLLLRATVALPAAGDDVRIGLYHSGDEDQRVRRLTILGDLRRAVRSEELRLFYQPKIALADGALCGAEALVRWEHPRLGRLSPAEFIPIAEQSGNISILTRWALTAAARECRLWVEEGLDIAVSVNLAAADLRDKELPWFVMEVLRDHDLAPRNLVAEITEEGVVRDFDNATLVLQRLRKLGIRISIDDFGTGYSSLAQIRNLPVDELKIDQCFVRNLPDSRADAAIVSAAIELAHDLGLEFVAEGVETRPALRWLREHGCERIQGYYVSPPLPAEQFLDWARNYAGAGSLRTPALRAG